MTLVGLSRLAPLIGARRHPPMLLRERRILIARRVRVIAALLGPLTFAWIPIDWLSFPQEQATLLSAGRLVAGLGLVLLAWRAGPGAPAMPVLGALAGIAVGFLGFATIVLARPGIGSAATLYVESPLLVATALALFPLTLVEAAVAAVPVVAVMTLQVVLMPGPGGAALLRLAVILGIAAASSLGQLEILAALTERSARDALTGVLGRQAGEEVLALQFSNALRRGAPLAVLFVDLDLFKAVNDGHGHDAGDIVLRAAARALVGTFRLQDSVIRWGGEEFLVVLPDTGPAEAAETIARLGDAGLCLRPDGTRQTASIGLAERLADAAACWPALVERADERMYAAKRAGRNRWIDCAGSAHAFAG